MRSAESLSFQKVFQQSGPIMGFKADPEPPKELPALLLPEGTGMAVHPIIDKPAFSATMDNYRAYIAKYNLRVAQENELINKHNALVAVYLNEAEISDADRNFVALFHKHYTNRKDYRKLTDREYNQKVEEFCSFRGHMIEKVRIQTVKYASELVFQNLLHLYSEQMNNVTFNYIKYNANEPRPLQELEIRSDRVTKKEREKGVKSLDVCNKTVRNHRQRLEEAGVLVDYKFCGHVAGVKVKVNPEILVYTDLFAEKLAALENQRVRQSKRKELPYFSKEFSTITVKNQCQIKDDALQSSVDKECAAPTAFSSIKTVSTENTGSKQQKISPGAAPETVKIEKSLSEKLREQILQPQELAVHLAAGSFNEYVPIDVRLLYREAGRGTLTEHEFRELFIQDFFKQSAKIWREHTPFVGSWKIALNEWLDNKFLTYNNLPLNKMTIAGYAEEYRWCINDARKWFIKTGRNPLFPNDYFDLTRKTKCEVGFEYQRTRYKRHLKGIADRAAKKAKKEQAAEKRKQEAKYAKYFKTEINRYLKDKITLQQLINYVDKNLPAHFLTDLPVVLNKHRNNL